MLMIWVGLTRRCLDSLYRGRRRSLRRKPCSDYGDDGYVYVWRAVVEEDDEEEEEEEELGRGRRGGREKGL